MTQQWEPKMTERRMYERYDLIVDDWIVGSYRRVSACRNMLRCIAKMRRRNGAAPIKNYKVCQSMGVVDWR